MRTRIVATALCLLVVPSAFGQDDPDLSYAAIIARHPSVKISDVDIARLRAEGECLAGVKALIREDIGERHRGRSRRRTAASLG